MVNKMADVETLQREKRKQLSLSLFVVSCLESEFQALDNVKSAYVIVGWLKVSSRFNAPRACCTKSTRKPSAHALTNLDIVAHVQDHFPYGYQFVNSDFRPCRYSVARCINLKKIVHTYKDNAHSNHIATGSKLELEPSRSSVFIFYNTPYSMHPIENSVIRTMVIFFPYHIYHVMKPYPLHT